MRVGVPILAMIVFGVAVVVIAGANSGNAGPAPPATALGFPPATLAGSDFTAAPGGRGISQSLGRVASDGADIVAVGSQTGARIPRAQFFFSPNDGRSWVMGSVRTPSGGVPPPGHAARYVAGGQGKWVAVGPGSIWTSPDGRTWTLTASAGMPLRPGDQISELARTAAGFIAVGANVPGGDQANASPVIFLSADGISWRRLDAGQLGLPAGTGRVLDLRYVAAAGKSILIAGDVATTEVVGKPRHTVSIQAGGAWLSSDGGSAWTAAAPPAGAGAPPQITGAAAVGDGFVLVRPATVGARPAVDVYRSANGTAWTPAATLSTPAGLVTGLVSGGPDGAVITGQAGQALTAFVSANGASWQPTGVFGRAASETLSGVAMTPARGRGDRDDRGRGYPPARPDGAGRGHRRGPGRRGEDPRRVRPAARRRRRRGERRHAGRGGQRQRIPGRLGLRRRRQLVDARPRRDPGGVRPGRVCSS